MRCCDQGAHIRERLAANRYVITLQGGPNQHGTQTPRRTSHTNLSPPCLDVAKMASHAIFQYNILVIDIDNTTLGLIWLLKMTILRLLGSSDDKKKIGVARPKGPPLRIRSTGRTDAKGIGASDACRKIRHPGVCEAPVEPTGSQQASVHWAYNVPETMPSDQKKILQHRMNRWCIGTKRRCNDVSRREQRQHIVECCEWQV